LIRDEKAQDKPSPSEMNKLAGAFDLSSPIFMGRMRVVDALQGRLDRLKAELQTEDQARQLTPGWKP
jgi:hypothetical protein